MSCRIFESEERERVLVKERALRARQHRAWWIQKVLHCLLAAVIASGTLVAGGALCSLAVAGCATPTQGYAIARKVQGGSADALLSTYIAWGEWDTQYQNMIVDTSKTREEAQARLADYRKTVQASINKAFDAARVAVQEFGAALDARDAYKQGDFSGVAAKVVAAFVNIGELFMRFGVGVAPPKAVI